MNECQQKAETLDGVLSVLVLFFLYELTKECSENNVNEVHK